MGCATDGTLLVEYKIMPDGSVADVEVLVEDLPKSAKRQIQKTMEDWRYYPAVSSGQPIETAGQRVKFNLIKSRN